MKTAIITGISKGIGRALTDKFLAEGFTVLGCVRGDVDFSHPNLKTFPLDLADASSTAKCAADIAALGSKPSVLVNNAGVLLDDEETHLLPEKLRQTLEVNVIGTASFTEEIISSLDNTSHIVNVSSAAGSLTETDHLETSHYPYHYPAYKISKAALNMYTRTLAVRLKHEGTDIIVSSIHPGWVKTDMGGSDAPDTPEEVAADIFALAVSRPPTGQFWYKGQNYPW
jgi:NAD(P)-dependent dehydrogenase (short-subunit alcohol dehydrogenase family)